MAQKILHTISSFYSMTRKDSLKAIEFIQSIDDNFTELYGAISGGGGSLILNDGILDWDTPTGKYTPYTSKTAGAFYYGTQNPDATTRLNWIGNFHANAFGLGDAGIANKYYGTDANKMLVAMADPLPLSVKQELELNDTWKIGNNLYFENVFTGSDLTQVNYWSDSGKGTKLFTKDITYTGGNPTSIVLKDEIAVKYLITTIVYSGSEVLNVTKVVS